MLQNISIERLEEINKEREHTMSDINFQSWVKELKVGRIAPKLPDRSREVMRLWTDKNGKQNTFDYIISKIK